MHIKLRKGQYMKNITVSFFALIVLAFLAVTSFAQQPAFVPFAQREVRFENGIMGKSLTFESANPRNFEDIISKANIPTVKLDGQLFLPPGQGPHPVIIIAAASLGISQDSIKHANHLTSAGFAVYMLDPFSGRGIRSTVADQSQLTRAASTYDVLAAARMLENQPGIDGQRMGALGNSRGGMAVLLAVTQQVTRAILGEGKSFKAAFVGWPWCYYQFENPLTTPTAVRLLVGDSDNWVSPVPTQGLAAAMRVTNPKVSIRFIRGAYHGFGNYSPVQEMPNAAIALNSPIMYINDQGAFIDWYTGQAVSGADDTYFYRLNAPWQGRGAKVGTMPGQTEIFITEMVGFFTQQMKP